MVDVYIPETKGFKTIVYFHGGGLVEGSRSQDNIINICNRLKDKGFCVFNFDYTLYPIAKFPDYLHDAAKAVSVAFELSEQLGGNGDIYVSGSSAGAYLCAMLLSNEEYLNKENINKLNIKGWFLESSQMTDHFHVLKYEFHLDPSLERISEYAPMFYIKKGFESSPIKLLAYNDDIPNRLKQNLQFVDLVKANSKTKIEINILKGTHCEGSSHVDDTDEYPFIKELIKFIQAN